MNKLRNRMILIGLIPFLGLVWATATTIYEERKIVSKLEEVIPLTQMAVISGNLIHELQKERGTQVGLISSKGADRFRQLVSDQRNLSDGRLKALNDYLRDFDLSTHKAELAAYLTNARNLLGRLDEHRSGVDSLTVSVADNVSYYTKIIYDLIDIIGIIQEESPDPEITQRLLAYRALVWSKEHAGLERAIGAAIFNQATFNPDLWSRYLGLVEKQNAYLHDFHVYATPQEKALFERTVQGADVDKVMAWRNILLDVAKTNDTKGIDGATWFSNATQRINKMKTVEDLLADETLTLAEERLGATATHAYIIVGIDIVIMIFAFLFGGWLLRSTAGPLSRVTEELLAVAGGKDDVDLPEQIGGGEEVQGLASAAKTFLNNRLERSRLVEEAARTQELAERQRKAALEEMAVTVERETEAALQNIRQSAETLSSVSRDVADSATNISANASDMKTASDNSLQSTQTVAAAAEELSASVGEITRQIGQQREIAARASNEASRSSETIDGLNDAASRIGDVIALIQDIAEQTNLLALNATIEAARAGDAGKGFAVVASEVKNLANQTARATEEISQQVMTMMTVSRDSSQAINAIVNVIGEMNDISNMVSDAVEQQAAATREITGNVSQSTQMSRNVVDRIGHVIEATETSRGYADRLSATSSDVIESMQGLQTNITNALKTASKAA